MCYKFTIRPTLQEFRTGFNKDGMTLFERPRRTCGQTTENPVSHEWYIKYNYLYTYTYILRVGSYWYTCILTLTNTHIHRYVYYIFISKWFSQFHLLTLFTTGVVDWTIVDLGLLNSNQLFLVFTYTQPIQTIRYRHHVMPIGYMKNNKQRFSL